MYYSKLFGKTVRDAKKDMTLASHKLLYKAGFTREIASGVYKMLPLGIRVQQKIIKLFDKEMEKIGSSRFSIPIMQPIETWKKTNRDQAWGKSLMKITDRNKAEYILSATGEGVVTDMVAESNPSYRDLPIILHQIIIKFRDELRPRGGLIRAREFDMKDAYSYHATEKDFMKTYYDFYHAYEKIFTQLDLPYYACIADSGALGGDFSHEFQIPCEVGEDKIVKCDNCDYAANTEKSEFEREEINKNEEMKNFEIVKLPEKVAKIKELMKHYNLPAERFIKNVVYKTLKGKLVIGTVTGNLDVNPVKLAKAVGEVELEIADENDLAKIDAKTGFVHSWGYEKFKDKIIFVSDIGITKARNLYGGFKTETEDPINVNYERDFNSDIIADIADPYEGAVCSKCKGKLKIIRAVELGHIFKYDHFYTKKHNCYFNDKDGKKKLMYMGAYGIGVGRAMALTTELHHDDKGIIWPISIAPFQVHLITLDKDENILEKAKNIYDDLRKNNIEVLWDERDDVSAGEKFADADLIGIPIRILISKRSLSQDGAEIKLREEKESEIIELHKIIDKTKLLIKQLSDEISFNE